MIIDGQRSLAYIDTIHDITPITGADNIELVHVKGWTCIAKKQEFKDGDRCIYFEIDSKVPANDKRFDFLSNKGFKIKTMKLGKFGVISQGLAMPLDEFPELKDKKVGEDVTSDLNVVYAVAEDNNRKIDNSELGRLAGLKNKKPKLFNNKTFKKLMKYTWFRNIILTIFKKASIEKKYNWPDWVVKTDEERIQNIPDMLKVKTPFIVTEKIDGTSTTFTMRRDKKKFKFYVCTRNRVLLEPTSKSYYNDGGTDNVYWQMADKYQIRDLLELYLKEYPDIEWVTVQGETFGPKICGNMLKNQIVDFRAFNFIDSVHGRIGSLEGQKMLAGWKILWVPIINDNYILPDTVDELIKAATGPSAINDSVLREGWVIRSIDGKISFKAVSAEYLLNKKE